MGMRKKLIELLTHENSPLFMVFGDNVEGFADYLISNGVTIPVRCKDCQKWQRHTQVDRERGDCRRYQTTKHETGFCDRGERRTDDR